MDDIVVPLYSLEAEKAAIGSAMHDEDAAERLAACLPVEAMYVPANRILLAAIKALVNRRSEVDQLLLSQYLTDQQQLDSAGGTEYIDSAYDYAQGIHSSHMSYIRVIHDKYRARQLASRCEDLAKDIHQGLSPDEAWMRAGALQLGLEAGSRDIYLAGSIDLTEARDGWIPCGIAGLDEKGEGGGIYPPGHLTMIGALTGHGKTAFMTGSAAHLSWQKRRVMYATLEMSREEIKARMVQNLCGWKRQPENLLDQDRWREANDIVKDVIIWDPSERNASEKNVEALVSDAMKWKDRLGFDVLFIDYAQLFGTSKNSENTTRAFGAVADELFRLAKKLRIAVVCGAQLIAPAKEEPRIADCSQFLKNSAVTIFLGIARPEEDHLASPTWSASATIKKTRNGNYGRVPLAFRWGYARFEDPMNPLFYAFDVDDPFADKQEVA